MTHPTAYVADVTHSPQARLKSVAIDAIRLTDFFWEPRRRINREATLPSQFAHLEESGVLDNLRRAAGTKTDVPFRSFYFADSDLYKWLEAASSALLDGGPAAEKLLPLIDIGIDVLEAAQRPDGYINSYFAVERYEQRYTNLKDLHEFYCAGHLFQAAVAHYRATGSDRLLNIVRRFADHIDATFGPASEGKREGTDGHPEIETALVELYRATGETRYRDLALYFVDARGRVPTVCYAPNQAADAKGGAYHQDHVPYRELSDVTGHAVRMLYLAAGAADLVLETGDTALRTALERQWANMTSRRMYVSGGLGARWEGEAFGKDFELPADRAYTETCAAIASVMWNHRMLLLTGDARYADLLEWTLYNAVLPGLSLDGEHYFYQNPLTDEGKHRRRPWFGCACCPPNVARLLAQLPAYFASVSDDAVWLHLYADSTANLTLPDGRTVAYTVVTTYPWSGSTVITVQTAGSYALNLRIPAWCQEDATVMVNFETFDGDRTPGTYVHLQRDWKVGDTIRFSLPFAVRVLEAHPYLTDAVGRVALADGPLLYCVEGIDHPGVDIRDLTVNPESLRLKPVPAKDLAGGTPTLYGIPALRGNATVSSDSATWGDTLYAPVGTATSSAEPQTTEFVAIPYYAWANREAGRMEVWLCRE